MLSSPQCGGQGWGCRGRSSWAARKWRAFHCVAGGNVAATPGACEMLTVWGLDPFPCVPCNQCPNWKLGDPYAFASQCPAWKTLILCPGRKKICEAISLNLKCHREIVCQSCINAEGPKGWGEWGDSGKWIRTSKKVSKPSLTRNRVKSKILFISLSCKSAIHILPQWSYIKKSRLNK